jgi:hypothetical protein
MDKLIVTREDMAMYRPISKNIPQDRVEVFINEAQILDLMPILGHALYYDFVNKFDQTGDPMYTAYQALLNGSTWISGGVTVQHYGLKPIVAYYALARLTKNNQINLTSYGVTSKVNPQSEPVQPLQLKDQINELNSVAVAYQDQVMKFLQENSTTYPLYNYNGENPVTKTSFRIIEI